MSEIAIYQQLAFFAAATIAYLCPRSRASDKILSGFTIKDSILTYLLEVIHE
jgi:hypothetical protein